MKKVNFNTKEAVFYLKELGLNFSPATLEVWRCQGKGPKYKKVARKVFYEKEDLDEFIKGEKFETIDTIIHL